MGRNLALNLRDHGYGLALFDDWAEARESAAARLGGAVHDTAGALVAALARPRFLFLLVKAGAPVDRAIEDLLPRLEPGDLIVDAGNSNYRQSLRRGAALGGQGIDFVDLGLSGGEEGARHGPCLMAGGPAQSRARLAPLDEIAARVDGVPCHAWMGGPGAGHFVKTLHNGIEYAAMQLIGEAYLFMRDLLALAEPEMKAVFAHWAEGELGSYLIEITADILGRADPATGGPLLDVIRDAAGQKGTGAWAAAEALELGVPAPSLAEAVAARALSALETERAAGRARLPGPPPGNPLGDSTQWTDALGDALLASVLCVHAQGFAVMAAGAREHGWRMDPARIARIWRGGSILRARLLEPIAAALDGQPGANLLLSPQSCELLARCQGSWRRVVACTAQRGLPAPALASALAYYDACRNDRLWASLIQAQRDYFGAHGFARVDRPGLHHGDWSGPKDATR